MASDSGGKLCVIPARGGSKRLPRKNVLDFRGRPMLAHTIQAARDSGCFARILVSSDDEATLEIAERHGADCHERDAALAGDATRVVAVILDVLESEAAAGRDYELLCCLYPAAPLRLASDVAAVVGLIEPGRCDFAMAVTDYGLPPHQALRLDGDKAMTPMFPDLIERRDEEVGRLVVDNGSTYAASLPAFKAQQSFYGTGLRGHVMPRSRSVDINSAEDLALADFYFERLSA